MNVSVERIGMVERYSARPVSISSSAASFSAASKGRRCWPNSVETKKTGRPDVLGDVFEFQPLLVHFGPYYITDVVDINLFGCVVSVHCESSLQVC